MTDHLQENLQTTEAGKLAQHEEAIRLRSLLGAVRNSHICVLYQTPDLIYVWGENVPTLWQGNWKIGSNDYAFLSETSAQKLELTKKQALADGSAHTIELSVTDGRETRWYEFYVDCDREPDGTILGIVTTIMDVSELKRREQILKTLLREVSHRSKNLLSIILSIAAQSARFTTSVDDFLDKFRGRIQSLSHSQDLVTDSNWRGALFHDLVRSQLSKYIDLTDPRLELTGDNPYLFPNAALHLGLALHELIINATSHGALTQESGKLTLSAHITHIGDGTESLNFFWNETDKRSFAKEDVSGPRFGSVVLQRIVPSSVNGTAEYLRGPHGVSYQLTLPDDQFDS